MNDGTTPDLKTYRLLLFFCFCFEQGSKLTFERHCSLLLYYSDNKILPCEILITYYLDIISQVTLCYVKAFFLFQLILASLTEEWAEKFILLV